jgi:pyruvate dehydrogenase E1 component alpha subunit
MASHCCATLTVETYTAGALAKVEKRGAVGEDTLGDFLREMLMIRRFEEKVEERFRAGELPGFLHVAIGQEAVAVGVARAMEDGDIFASTHRAHAHTLARGTHPNAVMAELYGKVEGCSHGYGGSMHLYDVERGNYGANAVIGGGLPAVTGAGLAFRLRNEPRVAVAFFGDGATNIGTFHESLNLAQLWKTKTVFVCENNHWAESTPGWQHSPVWDDMSKRALAFDMRSIKVDGQDVEQVHEAAHEALEHARSGEGPVFLDVETYRMHGHYIGDPQVYRSKEDRQEAADHDPITRLRERLALSDEEFKELDRAAHEIVDAALEFAQNGTDPAPEDALRNVYA